MDDEGVVGFFGKGQVSLACEIFELLESGTENA